MEIRCRVTSLTPLLMNSPACMGAGNSEGLKAKKEYKDEDEAKIRLYTLPSGQLYFPAAAFRKGLLEASKGRRIGKVSAKGVLQGSLFVTEPYVPLFRHDMKKKLKTWDDLDKQRVVVMKQGVMRVRPRMNEWAGTVEFEYDPDQITPEVILEVMQLAGKTQGVGDFRPAKTGSYGRYSVALVDE